MRPETSLRFLVNRAETGVQARETAQLMLITPDQGTASVRLSEILRSLKEFHFLKLICVLGLDGLNLAFLVDFETINLSSQLNNNAILLLRESLFLSQF